MGRRRGTAAITGSPVLIGAVTTLVTLVAVFLAYNANNGLPFVPTYNVKAELPSGANLVKNNDVRIGGVRVGSVTDITPVRRPDGTVFVTISMKLEKRVDPLPKDSTLLVRPLSALGLKYVEITPGESASGYAAGSTIPLSQAVPHPVEFDEFLNMFDQPTRIGQQRTLQGPGRRAGGTRHGHQPGDRGLPAAVPEPSAGGGEPRGAAHPAEALLPGARPHRRRRWPRSPSSRRLCSPTSTPPSPPSRAWPGRSSSRRSRRRRPRSTSSPPSWPSSGRSSRTSPPS